jgi:hypothetical protein
MKTEYLIAGKNGKGLQFLKNILMLNKFDGKKSIKKKLFLSVSSCGKIFHYLCIYSFQAIRRPNVMLDQH